MQKTSGLGVGASFWPTDRGCTPRTARSLGTVSAPDLGELAFLLAAAGARPVVAVAIATLAGATPRPAGGAHRWFGCVDGEYPGPHPCAPPVPQAELGGAPSRFGLLWRPKDVLLVIRPFQRDCCSQALESASAHPSTPCVGMGVSHPDW